MLRRTTTDAALFILFEATVALLKNNPKINVFFRSKIIVFSDFWLRPSEYIVGHKISFSLNWSKRQRFGMFLKSKNKARFVVNFQLLHLMLTNLPPR
jgi:hypothetical protein